MPRVRLSRSGDAGTAGQVVDVGNDAAEQLCSSGQAVPLDGERQATDPEAGLAEAAVDRASARRRASVRRGRR